MQDRLLANCSCLNHLGLNLYKLFMSSTCGRFLIQHQENSGSSSKLRIVSGYFAKGHFLNKMLFGICSCWQSKNSVQPFISSLFRPVSNVFVTYCHNQQYVVVLINLNCYIFLLQSTWLYTCHKHFSIKGSYYYKTSVGNAQGCTVFKIFIFKWMLSKFIGLQSPYQID